jgi:tetratricopeptide (TPR) repeat protein
VAYTDSLVGDFRRALEARGLLDDALVVITSDHGEGLGDHGEDFHGFFVYDTTVHAALIVKLPSRADAGRVVDQPVSHVDLLPTILEFANLPQPDKVQGQSLVSLLAGRDVEWNRPVYSESLYALLHYGWAPLRAIRTDRYKLIDVPRAELYDLTHDPSELTNLHDREADQARALAAALDDLRNRIDTGERPAATGPEIDEQTLAKLRSLGYVAGQGGAGAADENDRTRDDPKDRLVLHQKIMEAQSRIGHRENDMAKRLLEQVVAEDEEVLDAHSMLGQIAEEEHRPQDALRHYRRALELNPEHERSLFGLASAYAGLGRFDDALAGFRRIIELKGADARSSLAIADVYIALGRYDEAAVVLEQASAKGESSPYFLNKLGELRFEQGRDDEAIASFQRAIPPADDFPLPHFNLGVIYEKRGDVRAAAEHYERAIALEPRYFKAQFNLGRIHAASGDAERARQLWEACLVSNPTFVQGHYYLAKLLMDTGGDLQRAERLAREGIRLDPEHEEGPLGYYVLADLLNRAGRSNEARAAMARGREIQAGMK